VRTSSADAVRQQAQCEAEYEALATSRDSATATVTLLSAKTADLENKTASLSGAKELLEKEMDAALSANEKLATEKNALAAETKAAVTALDVLKREKASLDREFAAAKKQSKDLDRAVKDSEKRARSSALAAASAESSSKALEGRAESEATKAKMALKDKEALEIRTKALAAELAGCTTKKAALEGDLNSKAARLFDLEKAVVSLGAVESVVSKDHKKIGSASIEACSAGASGDSNLCLRVETSPSLGSRAASAAAGLARSAVGWANEDSKEETPGLVAIAGAVAAVWVFVVVMEKRRDTSHH